MGSEASGAPGGTDRGGSDPIGDFQRWLMRAGARSVGRDVADRVKTTLNGGRRTTGEVWETATTEPPPDEAPECAWCPICRAARRYRESSSGGGQPTGGQGAGTPPPNLGSQIAGVSETLAGLTRDAFSIFDAALRSAQRPPSRPAEPSRPPWASATTDTSATTDAGATTDASATAATGTGWPGTPPEHDAPVPPQPSAPAPPEPRVPVVDGVPVVDSAPAKDAQDDLMDVGDSAQVPDGAELGSASSDDGPVVGSAVLGRPAVHPQDKDGESAHEGGDREERGEAGDGPAHDGREDQVERPAE